MPAEEIRSNAPPRVAYQILGTCNEQIWGRDVAVLLAELLRRQGIDPVASPAEGSSRVDSIAIFRVDYFFDRSAVKLLLAAPNRAIVAWQSDGRGQPVAVLCAASEAERWRARILGAPLDAQALPQGLEWIDAANPPTVFEDQVRKRSHPLIRPINAATRDEIEARTFELAYKGVTDIVTKYVFPRPAFYATRFAARRGIHPNTVTTLSLLLVFVVIALFGTGHFAVGLLVGFVMSFLDTVDGKLARVTQTSSRFGNYFDHVIDMVHPPLWWIAWWWGGSAARAPQTVWWSKPEWWSKPGWWSEPEWWSAPEGFNEPGWWNAAGVAIFGGYIALRLLEWSFISTFGVRIHTWRRWDSRFRLISSRRNPNLILLSAATLGGRPDLGLAAVALWTLGCIAIHGVRWVQAWLEVRRSGPLTSWLEGAGAG